MSDIITSPRIGQIVCGCFRVVRRTKRTVTIFLQTDRDLGAKIGKPLTFRWDGVGFKRQGQYLTEGNAP